MGPYLVGVLFSYLQGFFEKRKYLAKYLLWSPLLIIVLHIHYLYVLEGREKLPFAYIQPIEEATLTAFVFALFIQGSALDSPDSAINRFLKNPVFQFISEISFEQYLLHALFSAIIKGNYGWYWQELPENFWGIFKASLLITLVPMPFSYFAHYYIALPIEAFFFRKLGMVPPPRKVTPGSDKKDEDKYK